MKKPCFGIIIYILILSQLCSVVFANDYSGHWAKDTIDNAFNNGIVTGDTTGSFYPDKTITRVEFLAMVMRGINADEVLVPSAFDDISIGDWFYKTVATAENMGIIKGTQSNKFNPYDPITRQDAMVIIGRAYKLRGSIAFNITQYHDGVYICDYAIEYMSYMCENGILNGYSDNTIRPLQMLTRAEALVVIDRMNTHIKNPDISKKISFADGYPKLRKSGLSKGFNILIKTNKPCSIYYTLGDIGKTMNDKTKIDKFLIKIDTADTDISAYIAADKDMQCNIYFKAVDEYGNESKTESIYNAKTLYYTEGDGSRENPFMISTEEQLDAMRYYLDKHFKLKNDIVLSKKWQPVGSGDIQDNMFTGSLDGNGYKISNLEIGTNIENAGMFGYIYSGEIRNLYVSSKQVKGRESVGIIAGVLNGGIIENCFTDGLVKAGENYAGALVGRNNGIIRKCQSAVFAVEAQSYAGGIAGWNGGEIEECMSCTYSVLANMYSSGIAGMNAGGTISNCLAANINITDYMTENNGRITTNKAGGKLKNNYAYNKMNASVGDWLPDASSPNGLDAAWENFSDKNFYTDSLRWKFDDSWCLPDKNDSFRLIYPKNLKKPSITEGVTIYAPKKIYTKEDLEKVKYEPDNNFILMNDISLPVTEESNWEVICGNEISENGESGFTGSFDGNGHTIRNMKIAYNNSDDSSQLYGMFGVVTGGIIKNLTLENVSISSVGTAGAVAAVNYGTVMNCAANGTVRVQQSDTSAAAGGITGENYGTVQGSQSNITINAKGNSVNAGGITAVNEGMVIDCGAKGSITSRGKEEASSCSAGGIAGFNTGYIHEVYSAVKLKNNAQLAYTGGICGMQSGGEIYKASSDSQIEVKANSTLNSAAYAGGIIGLSGDAAVIHCFSASPVYADGANVYIGGIGGYNLNGYVQDCYTLNTLKYKFITAVCAGGIIGINENGFVTSNAALNPEIGTSGNVGRICGDNQGGFLGGNYAYIGMKSDADDCDNDLNGTGMDIKTLTSRNFYFKPISDGGLMGWPDSVWEYAIPTNPYYTLPVLKNVKGQDGFTLPLY